MTKLFELFNGDSKLILPELIAKGITVDCVVTDPPYHLTSMVDRFGKTNIDSTTKTSERSRNKSDGMARFAKGFMGQEWDGGNFAFKSNVSEHFLIKLGQQ